MGSPETMYQFMLLMLLACMVLDVAGTGTTTAYESLYTVDAFSQQQTCVQSCFIQGYANIDCYTDVLGSMIGCPNSPCSATFAAVDQCYCRGDLQTAAHDWLSTCINTMCSVGDNSVNLGNAASIYSGYCTAKGFMALPAQNTAEATSPGSIQVPSTASTGFGAKPTSSTISSSTTPLSSTSTNNTMVIALAVVGSVAAIAILVAGITCWKIRRQRRRVPKISGGWSNNLSTLNLQQHSGSRISETVHPDDSASSLGSQPAIVGPFYPNYAAPSMLSTHFPGNGPSTVGPRRNYTQY
jgi:hypothetical protein